jgi:hypothetical protein
MLSSINWNQLEQISTFLEVPAKILTFFGADEGYCLFIKMTHL